LVVVDDVPIDIIDTQYSVMFKRGFKGLRSIETSARS